jgi:Nucleoside 2-deoxyribosyltransferase
MIYIYNAGPLFSEAEVRQRKEEGRMLEELLQHSGKEYFIANPIDLPFDNSKVLNSADIFSVDYDHINKSNAFFFELASGDTGTMVELGNVIEKYINGKEINIYPIFGDFRLQRNDVAGIECPIGFNSYLVGALTHNEIRIYYSFQEAFVQFKKDFDL